MKSSSFWKMSGAGNDFVLVEGGAKAWGPADARRLCDRRRGVGADGLLVVERPKRGGRARLRYFNSDGSAAFCGNGTRCAASWLHARGWVKGERFELETNVGVVEARRAGRRRFAVRMPDPSAMKPAERLTAAGREVSAFWIDTGVPHAVVFWGSEEGAPVFELGRALRRHSAFAPAGANVNFAGARAGGLWVRTYERGVEDETLACGTGVTATALVAAALGKVRSPVKLRTRGGDTMKVSFKRGPNGRFTDVWLEGPAEVVFTGVTS